MWTREQKNTLSIIYGDDMKTVGDILVARNEDKTKCYLINTDGQLLVDEQVLGVGQFLGRGGFHYIVITDEVKRPNKNNRVRTMANYNSRYSRMGFTPMSLGSFAMTPDDTLVSHYKYKIFNSNFECEYVGEQQCNRLSKFFCIEVGGRLYELKVQDCIVKESREEFAF